LKIFEIPFKAFIEVFCNEIKEDSMNTAGRPIIQPGPCDMAQICPDNFDWNPQTCSCECLRIVDCKIGYKFDPETCSCKKGNCDETVLCPEKYFVDENCQCKCTEEPHLCGIHKRWDENICDCVSTVNCDYEQVCPPGLVWCTETCSCIQKCKNLCPQNFAPDPHQNCKCVCQLPMQSCKKGYVWNIEKCACVKKPTPPCSKKKCPENYSPDPKDKCKCKCNESPIEFCGRGRGWDRTTCQCVSMCDFIDQCPKGQVWSLRTCQCVKICKNRCPKNFAADPDQNCECLCTLPAQTCRKGYKWSKKTCSCVKAIKVSCGTTVCPENYTADPNDSCKCKCNSEPPPMPDFPRLGSRWDQTTCQWINWCDFIMFCDNPKEEWSFGSCSCKPTCHNVCPENFAPDIDQNCECLCTLPAESCPNRGSFWNKKTCSCSSGRIECSEIFCKNQGRPDPNNNCECIIPMEDMKETMKQTITAVGDDLAC
jgi:hypothetical protein